MRDTILLTLAIMLGFSSCKQEQKIKLLQFNIWQEGTTVKGGYDAIIDELVRTDADFVMFSEVRNYNDTRFCDRITNALKERDLTYYSFYSEDSGLLSKHPIIDSAAIFPLNNDHGTIYKLIADVNGTEVAVYTAHLDYLSCAYYDVRGYDGNTWAELEKPLTNIDSILQKNVASMRDDAIKLFVKDADKELKKGRLIFLGGDFNEPSHLDWTEETKNMGDHQGLVIPWDVTTMLDENGFKDSFREMYPDPVKNPGYTYPADCKDMAVNSLTWAPDADERERIDYIFYYPTEGLKLTNVAVYGPQGNIVKGVRTPDSSNDIIIEPLGVWPSDHKAIIAEFTIE